LPDWKIGARRVTLAATFAAIYAVLRAIPTFQMVFGQGARFSAGDFALTSMGLLLDPIAAVLAVVGGTIVGYAFRAPIFLGLDFFPGVVHVLVVSLAVRGRRLEAGVIFAIPLLAYSLHPYSMLFLFDFVPFYWLHLFALLLLLSPVGRKFSGVPNHKLTAKSLLLLLVLLSLVGTMSQHIAGSVLFEIVFGNVLGQSTVVYNAWPAIFLLYPLERPIIISISTILGAALIRALRYWRY
jgi:hypothetical protein